MARDKNKGRVEFQDSEGTTYYLKMGTNEFCEIQDALGQTSGHRHTAAFFHQALIKGDPSQKDITPAESGELMDDIGYAKVKALLDQTTFSKHMAAAIDAALARQKAENDAKVDSASAT